MTTEVFRINIEGFKPAIDELSQLEVSLKKVTAERNALLKKQKDGESLTKEEAATLQRVTAEQARLSQEKRKAKKVVETEVKLNRQNIGAYERLSAQLNKARARYKDLAAQNKGNTKEARALREEVIKLDRQLKRIDGSVGQNQRSVGKYTNALKGLGGQIMGALGITTALFTLVNAYKNAINVQKEFEKQVATLSGVLDVSIEKVTALRNQAIRLGAAYPTLAKEVMNLQTAYARLGFSMDEILNMTEGTIVGSFALNAELGGTAELVGAVVKSYDELTSIDTVKIIDQLTKSTQRSSLSFESLMTALPKVAGAANALNIPLNETLAVLGTSIDATQDASIAGTSFRKILLDNASAGRTLSEGLDIIRQSTNKVTTATELYGDRAAIVALALANNIEKTKELSSEIDNSLGVSARTAAKQMDTLAGSLDSVASAYERILLTENTGTSGIRALADNLAAALNVFSTVDLGGAGGSLGPALATLFGIKKSEREEIAKRIKSEYDYINGLTIEQLNEIIPTQEKVIEEYRKEGRDVQVRIEERKLERIKELIDERTQTEIAAEETKAKKLEELLKKEQSERESAAYQLWKATGDNIIQQQEYNELVDGLNQKILKDVVDKVKELNQELKNIPVDEEQQVGEAETDFAIEQYQESLEGRMTLLQSFFQAGLVGQAEFNEKMAALMQEQSDLEQSIFDQKVNNLVSTVDITAAAVSGISNLLSELRVNGKSMAYAEALLNTFAGATLALTDKTIPNTFARIAAMVAVLSSGLAQAAKIKNTKFAKGGVIGGSLHSQGGTQFVGSDGSAFEAERGELLAIVNRRDTAELQALSKINSKHGKPFFAAGGTFTPQAGNNASQIAELSAMLKNQRVYVLENDITTTQRKVQVTNERADI